MCFNRVPKRLDRDEFINHGDAFPSILFVHPFAAVSRVADQGATLRIYHEIELFQRQLADQHRNVIGHLHHVQFAGAVLNRVLHNAIRVGLDNSVLLLIRRVVNFFSPSCRIMRVGSDK